MGVAFYIRRKRLSNKTQNLSAEVSDIVITTCEWFIHITNN